ncbi:MAG: DUF1059 domain-containing protein [Candidatus Hodarchaeota archaeon]
MVGTIKIVWCGELGEEYADCDFKAVGKTEDEIIDRIIEHTKKEHGITIEKGSYTERILRRLVHILTHTGLLTRYK